MSDSQLLEETFTVNAIDDKRYDRVSRLSCTSTDATLTMTLDINHELLHVEAGNTIQLVLATSLSLENGGKDGADMSWRNVGRAGHASLADMFDYVCYGRQYKFEDGDNDTAKCYASFGGLLLYLEGPYKKLNGLKIDNLYLLVKK